MIGRKPEPVPGVKPGRWRVVRARGLPESERAWWYVDREGCYGSMCFHTWREAQDWADRQARTREVVLPRAITMPHNPGAAEWDFSEWAGLSYTPAWPESAFYDRRGGPIGRHFQGDVSIRREHWKPLALALLALAEQEDLP